MSEYTQRDQEEYEAAAQAVYAQQQAAVDYYGQAAGGPAAQQTNLAAAQYGDLASNPELAHLLQQEASKQAAMGMPYGMPMMGVPPMYRMPQEMVGMPAPMGGAVLEEEPLYVNAKQYNRILKRRAARAKIDAQLRQQRAKQGERAPYMHESRHKHAMKRPRGPGGRFLTAAEIAALKEKDASSPKAKEATTDSDSNTSQPSERSRKESAKA